MSFELFIAISYSQTALSALVAILSWIKFKHRDTSIKLIGLSFLLGFLSNGLPLIFYYLGIKGLGNYIISVYGIVNFLVLTYLYWVLHNKRATKFFASIMVLFLFFSLYNNFFLQRAEMNSYTDVLSSIFILLYSLSYFYILLKGLPATDIHRFPMFWFNSAFLIYRAGSLFLFAMRPYLINALKDNLITFWGFHNILNIIAHFLILTGLWYDLQMVTRSKVQTPGSRDKGQRLKIKDS